jgi:hypothetical protein
VCFLYGDGTYIDFYINIYKRLLEYRKNVNIIWLFTPGRGLYFDNRIHKDIFIPAPLIFFIKNYVIITANVPQVWLSSSKKYFGIMHGFGSFGSVINVDHIHRFGKLFLATPYQYFQLTEGDYKGIFSKQNLVKGGYPKIDNFIQPFPKSYECKNKAVFYGPTYHVDISSIFDYLIPLIEYTEKRNIKLFIKLHPFLYNKDIFEHSGKIDWVLKINEPKIENDHVTLLEKHTPFNEVVDYFKKSDYFITDNSGLGYEYSLITGRPTVWLGEKLKIPLEDLDSLNATKYSDFQEIKYRGIIGPIISDVDKLDLCLDKFSQEMDNYYSSIRKFRTDFTFNLGQAAPVAAQAILELI